MSANECTASESRALEPPCTDTAALAKKMKMLEPIAMFTANDSESDAETGSGSERLNARGGEALDAISIEGLLPG